MPLAIAKRIKQKNFQVAERSKIIGNLEMTVAEFERSLAILNKEIESAENRNGIHDPKHFAYSLLAKATSERRDNVARSLIRIGDELSRHKVSFVEELEELDSMQRMLKASEVNIDSALKFA